MLKFFKRTPVKSLAGDLIYEAERKLLEHETAAEHHAALAGMYRARVQRMRGEHQPGALPASAFHLGAFSPDLPTAGAPAQH